MEERTLYVSDLDGTLLQSNETTSEYTNKVINKMTEQGLMFSYATARSIYTSKKVTKGLNAKIPIIVYNGAFIMDNQTGEILAANYFKEDVYDLLQDLFHNGVYPMVYAFIDGAEKFSYIEEKSSKSMLEFIETRNDDRRRSVENETALMEGNCFYITCIDLPEKLFPFYEKYKEKYHCIYQKDIYSGEQWLEFMPLETTKANAIKKLKTMLQCNRVVVFGDGINDIEMFQIADECYAVANAVPELKEIATSVIDSNNDNGVAVWLEKNAFTAKKMRMLFEIDTKDYNRNGTVFERPSARGIIIKDNKVAMIHSLKYNYYKFPGGGREEKYGYTENDFI